MVLQRRIPLSRLQPNSRHWSRHFGKCCGPGRGVHWTQRPSRHGPGLGGHRHGASRPHHRWPEGATTPCIACHTLAGVPGAVGLVGPDLSHIGTDAANRKDGLSAAEYIYESIMNPMPLEGVRTEPIRPIFGSTEADVAALVAFLLEQK